MRLALMQSRQNEIYNFPDQEKRWTMNEKGEVTGGAYGQGNLISI